MALLRLRASAATDLRPPLIAMRVQGLPLEETQQHVAAMVEGLRGRAGSKYAAIMAAGSGAGDGP